MLVLAQKDTISDEQKVSMAIIIYRETIDYVSLADYRGISELTDRLQQKIVKREIVNDELIISINYVFISYKPGSTYDKPN